MTKFITLFMNITCGALIISCAQSQTFREKLKERLIKRFQDKPAPEISRPATNMINSPGDYTFSVKSNGIDRYYKVHVPKSYNPLAKTPLLFIFHGGGGNMEIQSNEKYYKQISHSDSLGYIALFPNGYSPFKSGKMATWNAGKCCGEARDKDSDDVAFIREILTDVHRHLNIDNKKIYSTGMSNGGMFSYRLACEMPETFKAIAAVAGTDNTINCTPKTPTSILHIHAKNDDQVLFDGGLGPKALSKSAVTEFNSVSNTVAKWVKLNQCPSIPKRVLEIKGAYCDQYFPCKENTEVKLCVTEDGGHSWPGGKKPRGTQQASKAFSANDMLWDFFKDK